MKLIDFERKQNNKAVTADKNANVSRSLLKVERFLAATDPQ